VGALEDLLALGWKASGIAWSVLGELLQEPRMHDGRTALEGVRELLPGQSMTASGETSLVWSPATFAHEEIGADDGRELVRKTVLHCVGAWARRYERILHPLSGGLDSSVVLACIAKCGLANRVRCLNFTAGDGSELDEGGYAREAAARAGVELVQRKFNPRQVKLSRARAITNTPRPAGYAFSIENDEFELEAAEAWRADACFSAAGGDGLFYQLRAKIYCADYLQLRGLRPGLARVAYESARLTRSSIWSTLALGFRFRNGSFDPAAAPRNPYLADGVGAEAEGWFDRHPWARSATLLPPGKKLHLWALLDALNFTYNYRRAEIAETILPLVSQPIIETMLRIPSFVLARGGTDRTLVREAFADDVPASIIGRSGKGAMDGYYAELCCANAAVIRDRLLGGVLASKGLLDTTRVAKALPARGEPADGAEADLLKLFAAEVWAEAW
jgi:asparagine synthase (glutamine-hydrolysing)